MTSNADVVIVGGGIVGLATALALGREPSPRRALVLEKEAAIGAHQTGHNSGVIHSGLYYKPGSFKAKFCVEGARRMVAFAREHGIAHEICGKVVVATDASELPRLEELHRRAIANGVPDVELLGPEQLREIEPHAAGLRALRVPGTGIIDFVGVARRYVELIAAAGGEVRNQCKVTGFRRDGAEWIVESSQGEFRTRHLINCSGLYSDWIARLAGCAPQVRIIPFRGEYYELRPESHHLVKALIYPVPDPAFPFLGVHFTRMVHGGVEAGPNAVLAFKREGYRMSDFDAREAWDTFSFPGFWRLAAKYWRTGAGEFYRSFRKAAFVRALQRLLPELTAEDLSPGGAGVRAQAIDPSGALVDDFAIQSLNGIVHVLNAPSPAATASLAIGDHIAAEARRLFQL